jgi:hypothetical protein
VIDGAADYTRFVIGGAAAADWQPHPLPLPHRLHPSVD